MGWTAERLEFKSHYGQDISPLYIVQTGSEAHSASYSVDIEGSYPGGGVKQPGHEADPSPPTSVVVKNMGTYI
jgi:hypothetical protein